MHLARKRLHRTKTVVEQARQIRWKKVLPTEATGLSDDGAAGLNSEATDLSDDQYSSSPANKISQLSKFHAVAATVSVGLGTFSTIVYPGQRA